MQEDNEADDKNKIIHNASPTKKKKRKEKRLKLSQHNWNYNKQRNI